MVNTVTRRNVSRYQAPRTAHSSIAAFLVADVSRGIHTIDYNGLPLDVLVQPQEGADTLLVSLHPAMPAGASTPVFVGVGVSHQTGAHRLFVSDPSLELDDGLALAWFAGNRLQPLQRDLPEIVEHVRAQVNARHVIFYGPSGGGFAALYYSAQIPGSLAVPTNPQTIIANYEPRAVETYSRVCWDRGPWDNFSDLREVYRNWPGNTVLYLQNAKDNHVEEHLEPLLGAISAPTGALEIIMGQWGDGHVAPPRELISDVLRIAAGCSGRWEKVIEKFGTTTHDPSGGAT